MSNSFTKKVIRNQDHSTPTKSKLSINSSNSTKPQLEDRIMITNENRNSLLITILITWSSDSALEHKIHHNYESKYQNNETECFQLTCKHQRSNSNLLQRVNQNSNSLSLSKIQLFLFPLSLEIGHKRKTPHKK